MEHLEMLFNVSDCQKFRLSLPHHSICIWVIECSQYSTWDPKGTFKNQLMVKTELVGMENTKPWLSYQTLFVFKGLASL